MAAGRYDAVAVARGYRDKAIANGLPHLEPHGVGWDQLAGLQQDGIVAGVIAVLEGFASRRTFDPELDASTFWTTYRVYVGGQPWVLLDDDQRAELRAGVARFVDQVVDEAGI